MYQLAARVFTVKVRPPLVARVEAALRRLGVGPGAGVVAVSGGPDSVALLAALACLRAEDGGRLVVAHFNHRLRGAESDADEDFVRDLAVRLGGLEFRREQEETAARARDEGANLEALARRLRYDWLARVAAECGAGWVATGHTADDQAETVLHRLLRGSGLQGLRGIAARRPLAPGVLLVRPLLAAGRAEVLDYLASIGQPYRLDSSNASLDYTRNRIRHELLPLLARDYNPAVIEALCRLAEQAEDAYRLQEEQARDLLTAAELPRAGTVVVLDRQRLAAGERRLVREALRLVWEREGWPMGGMGYDAWDRAAGVVLGEAPAVDLPGGCRLRAAGRVVRAGPAS